MKTLLISAILMLATSAQAASYVCTVSYDRTTKKNVYIKLNIDKSAVVEFENKKAYGTYTTKQAHCPSRLCGHSRVDIVAQVPNAAYGEVGTVHANLTFESLVSFAGISFYTVGGRAPYSNDLDCYLSRD